MLAVAGSLRQAEPQIKLYFAGVKPFEKQFAQQVGAEFIQLNAVGLKRRPGLAALVAVARATAGTVRLARFIRKHGIDAVFAAGGYASFPAAAAAVLTEKPLYIHEQNTVPGLVNRVFAPFARKVFLSFPVASGWRGSKFMLVGYPLRPGITGRSKREALDFFKLEPDRFTLLAFGGSQGSKRINEAVVELARRVDRSEAGSRFQIIHACGADKYDETVRSKPDLEGVIYRLFPQIEEMGLAYAAADLVVSRAGAGTIAEICACKKPAVLVPYPYAAADHQMKNALLLEKADAAVVIKDSELDGETLFQTVSRLMSDAERREKLAENASKFAIEDAAQKISSYIISESHADR